MSPPIRDGSGNSIGSIRLGDGTEIAEVRTGAGDVLFSGIPDTLVNQYDFVANWSQPETTVPDSVGSADMSLTGNPQDAIIGGESGAEGDGTADYGLANGPETLPQNETFGLAFTFKASGISAREAYYGSEDSSITNRLYIYSGQSGTAGNIQIDIADGNSNFLRVYTNNTYDDGTPKAVIINKNGNNASDISIYVGDMSSAVADTDAIDDLFDHTNYTNSRDLAAFARNSGGTVENHMNVTFGVLEFNSAPYSQSERDGFLQRRNEV